MADAVQREPVSTLKFPANRGKEPGIFQLRANSRPSGRYSSNDLTDLERNSLRDGTGNFCKGSGNFDARTGNLNQANWRHTIRLIREGHLRGGNPWLC